MQTGSELLLGLRALEMERKRESLRKKVRKAGVLLQVSMGASYKRQSSLQKKRTDEEQYERPLN